MFACTFPSSATTHPCFREQLVPLLTLHCRAALVVVREHLLLLLQGQGLEASFLAAGVAEEALGPQAAGRGL